jgi:hypothetical protein
MDICGSHLPEADIDSQSSAYRIIIEELKHLDLYNIVLIVVIGILILIIYIFSRTTLEIA